MLKLVLLQRGCKGGPEPRLGSCATGASSTGSSTGTKTGQTVAVTRYFTRSLSAASEQRAGLAVACVMGWQAVGGGMSPWVTGSSSQGLRLLELVWEMLLDVCQLWTSHFLGPDYGLEFEMRWKARTTLLDNSSPST